VKRSIGRLTSAQIRAARALLRWSAEDLARESTLGPPRRAHGQRDLKTAANDLAVRRALEAAGVEFIDETVEVRAFGCGSAYGQKLRRVEFWPSFNAYRHAQECPLARPRRRHQCGAFASS